MDLCLRPKNYTWLELNLGGGGSGGSGGRRGKSSASVYPIPHWVWPSGVERIIHRQRESAKVRTLTTPVMMTALSNIYILAVPILVSVKERCYAPPMSSPLPKLKTMFFTKGTGALLLHTFQSKVSLIYLFLAVLCKLFVRGA